MDREVIVVGGGPGGSSAAYHLSSRGVEVLLMDKASFPRDKVCGDGVAPRAVRSLYRMGLKDRLEGRFNKFHGFRFAGAGKALVENPIPPTPRFPDHGYIIKRTDLDPLLLDYARESGAEVWEGCAVTEPLVENGRVTGVRAERQGEPLEVTARVVVGADGARSTLGKAMGLLVDDPVYLGVSVRQYFQDVEGIGDFLEVYPDRCITPGSGWVFPVSESVANVGVGAMLYHIKRDHLNLNRMFEDFIRDSRFAAPKLKKAEPVSPLRGALLRVGLGGSRVECPGLILVGDAASMTNPVSGEGITYALETGRMAAEHILDSRMDGKGLRHDPAQDSFAEKLRERYLHYFRTGTRSIKWGNRTSFLRPLLAFISRSEKHREELIRALMYLRH